MSKNYKERAAYAYLHDTGRRISRNLLYCIKRKWWRHNYDVGEMRKKKNELIKKQTKHEDKKQ